MRTDDVLEEIAARLERPDLIDMRGILAKRKRDREDARLRMEARQEQRREIAKWIRSFKSEGGNSYVAALENIQDNKFAWGPDVAAALANRHATLSVAVHLSTHLENSAVEYTVTLTDAGRALVASAAQFAGETNG